MYVKGSPRRPIGFRSSLIRMTYGLAGLLAIFNSTAFAQSDVSAQSDVIRHITNGNERMELTVNTSRILTLEKRIPKMVVNNPDLVTVTALSANQIQLAARKPGVTQVNLWDEDGKIFTVDVMIYGDVRELQLALKRLFPESSLNVVRLTNSLVLEGFVERPEAVSPIIRLAEDYAPKVINNITVGGVQQVFLKVKVMEVSRTKMRALGIDWAQRSGSSIVSSTVAGVTAAKETFRVGIVDGSDSFLSVLEALQQNQLAKILADPTITAISGRPAHFNVGGELPIVVPSGLGQSTIEWKEFGTQVDFLPIVLGNGNIRLEVRPRVSEIDDTRSIEIDGFTVPALKVREVDTGVELKAGQTLALAGLVQTRVEAQERGLPFVSDLPYIGALFRSVEEEVNEIELLILVTPELADGMEPHQVPPCGPGMESVSPSNCQLYFGAHLEVPACGPCGPDGCNCQLGANGACYNVPGGMPALASDGGTGQYVESYGTPVEVETLTPMPAVAGQPADTDSILQPTAPNAGNPAAQQLPDPNAQNPNAQNPNAQNPNAKNPNAKNEQAPWLRNQVPAQFSREKVSNQNAQHKPVTNTSTPGLIGPIGYDVE